MRSILNALCMKEPSRRLILDPALTLVTGRSDGFGMIFCNFLYFSGIARETERSLYLIWPQQLPHLPPETNCSLDLLFSDYNIDFIPVAPSSINRKYWQKVEADTLAENLPTLRQEFRLLKEHERIIQAHTNLPRYDYAIHARLGDVEKKPLQHGGTGGRYFPRSGYKLVIQRIIERNPKAKIFLSSNSDEVLEVKHDYPANITTENDLFDQCSEYDPNTLAGLWLVVRQLSKAKNIISPLHSSFSLLARIASEYPINHFTPSRYLGIDDIIIGMHRDYSAQAKSLVYFSNSRSQRPWLSLLMGGWKRVNTLIRLGICSKIMLANLR